MASKILLDMMDEIINDMKSKKPEELFNDLYMGSEHFRRQWDEYDKNGCYEYECCKIELKLNSSHDFLLHCNDDFVVAYKENFNNVDYNNIDDTKETFNLDLGENEWLVA